MFFLLIYETQSKACPLMLREYHHLKKLPHKGLALFSVSVIPMSSKHQSKPPLIFCRFLYLDFFP